MEFKCPKCGSTEVVANVLACGFAYVDMTTGELTEQPEECDYDRNDLNEFICNNFDCGHEWWGEVPDELFAWWREKREREWVEHNARMEMIRFETEMFKDMLHKQHNRMNNYNEKISRDSVPKIYLTIGSNRMEL